jgi:hypothetical protein
VGFIKSLTTSSGGLNWRDSLTVNSWKTLIDRSAQFPVIFPRGITIRLKVSLKGFSMNPIPVIEEYLGYDLTLEAAKRLATAPEKHIEGLVNKVTPFYYDWLEKAQNQNPTTPGYLFCVDPVPQDEDWRQLLERYKKYLLYLPRFAVPDPLAQLLKPLVTVGALVGYFLIDDTFRRDLQGALSLLAELSSASREQDILLLPQSFAFDYTLVQQAARRELSATEQPGIREEYYHPILESIDAAFKAWEARERLRPKGELKENPSNGPPAVRNDQLLARNYAGGVKLAGQLCAALDLTPIAGNEITHAILAQEYAAGMLPVPAAEKVHRITGILSRYVIPGVGQADVETILALRRNEKVFGEFRQQYAKVLDQADSEGPIDQRQFEVEFRQACDDLLKPRIEELKKTTTSSALEKFLIPAALGIGAAAAAFSVTGSLAVTSAAGIAITPLNWLLDKLRKRFIKSGRNAQTLVEVYGLLADAKG